MAVTFYERLGVSRNASKAEIKTAFRALAKQYHPDKDPSVDAGKNFSEIMHAYQVLSSDTKRAVYDASVISRPLHVYPAPNKSPQRTVIRGNYQQRTVKVEQKESKFYIITFFIIYIILMIIILALH